MRRLLTETIEGYIGDDAFSRGAAIAYFTLFSLAPVLLLVIAVAGLVFGQEAAEGAVVEQLSGLMGRETAEAMQAMIRSASDRMTGLVATVIGLFTILLAASGVFGEVQSALNAIWKAKPRDSTMSRLLRARLASFGLVITLGFVLIVSLALSAALTALGKFLRYTFPAAEVAVQAADLLISVLLISGLFAIMYKVLPETLIRWRDVAVGALAATGLFEGGKYLIALYIGQSNVASSFGAAGALIVLLLWIFYSAQIFLLGAEFTRAWTHVYGARCHDAPAGVVEQGGKRR
ncbi:YihY/virulence factor BrkB family protein [Reyranella sp.]|jgi:membrane protein|uniref:YihY/virulence factor BrkB family protein n=1 Tax=Reyranella sp. TaxID=1929291 RepID=UPI000BCA27AE|nr:YihY/virulence factor BrkB family protein [Reyranella sp.]OYY42598.1 MAG: ribonuclease BN [Rhodospirillales bacterium 35-66-84]OYZ94455.1 MAG: ribonuclease BN [Rhodospirillales bacterium 24-66-33]OZB25377.1 MAG: ribonuclease BN [Rhodospirillales bacterium 39-66-50]HQS16430.1 YihY/virulence factor BrkB family protein [Reyranella sp.]HQT13470.1 YihY/virulence factor BrkB family protein [Reyranella sp.]